MYKRVRLKDTVEVPPRHLADVSPELVKRLLQDKLEERMDEDVGSVVSVTAVHDIGDGAVLPNRPGVYYEAEFDAVTFDPQEGHCSPSSTSSTRWQSRQTRRSAI